MAKSVANVNIATDTFAGWVGKTNVLLDAMTNEVVSVSNTVSGANVSGNGTVYGTLSANTLSASVIRGGGVGNTANVSFITIGIANSTVSSNVVITGYTANVSANALNITSNTVVNAASFTANVSAINAYGNVVINSNTSHNFTFAGNTGTINAISLSVSSNINFTGANVIVSTTNAAITSANLTIDGGDLNLFSNTTFTGDVFTSSANLDWNSSNVYINTTSMSVIGGTISLISNVYITAVNTDIESANTFINGGRLNIASNVYVTGVNTAIASTNTAISGGRLNISSNVNITGANTTITGVVTLSNTISISSNATLSGTLLFNGSSAGINQTSGNYAFPGDGSSSNVVDSFVISEFKSAKYTVSAKNNANADHIVISEITGVVNSSNVFSTEFGTIFSNTKFITYSLDANTTHVRLLAVANSTITNTNITVVRTSFK
jgi:hypothetical protein